MSRFFGNFFLAGLQWNAKKPLTIRGGIVNFRDGILQILFACGEVLCHAEGVLKAREEDDTARAALLFQLMHFLIHAVELLKIALRPRLVFSRIGRHLFLCFVEEGLESLSIRHLTEGSTKSVAVVFISFRRDVVWEIVGQLPGE